MDFQSIALPTELRYHLTRGANLIEFLILRNKTTTHIMQSVFCNFDKKYFLETNYRYRQY